MENVGFDFMILDVIILKISYLSFEIQNG